MKKGTDNLIKLALVLVVLLGGYLIVAWASYSPLDNAWSVASSATHSTLNRTGVLGAWLVDLLLATWGKVGFILPFSITFTSIYLLVFRQTATLTWQSIGLWCVSFGVLMWGVAGLADVILPHSPYYLAGGFAGAFLSNGIGDVLGQIGVLLVAMILVSVGFYFCSGQILLQLFNRLYNWIFEEKSPPLEALNETSPAEPNNESNNKVIIDILQKFAKKSPLAEPENAPQEQVKAEQSELETAMVAAELSPHTNLTDLSRFARPTPNITGLKSPESVINQPAVLTDLSRFKPENIQPLPKVNVANEVEPKVFSHTEIKPVNEERIDFGEDEIMPMTMPKIRLNPLDNSRQPFPDTATQEDSLSKVSIFDEPKEINLQLPIETTPSVKLTQEPVRVPKFMAQEGNVAREQTLVEEATPQAEIALNVESSPTYPKGYGESLIHPLLQKKTKLEKPSTPLPTLDLLTSSPSEAPPITEPEIIETSARIEQELANFGVKATVEDVLVGPVVTRYEIKPAAGVKASKITNLDSDLARALIFKAIRITDVVPGKPYMGIETPNKHRETVWLRDVLDSNEFRQSKAILPMALGKDISGEPVVVDMAKMPHLLVAGQTGGGKSVGVNTMILSLLYKLTPEQLRFIMIDPKVVELSIYNDIPHLLTPVVTDMKKAENALRWAVEEMERRYLLVSSLSVRNIEGYNEKIKQAEEMGIPIPNPLWRPGDTMDSLPPPLEKLSYIVLIVDEFADLMMSAGKQVEDHIMRIAQKARAVGIHLILATQRPSTDVITGVIKANIPSRIAFTVASQIDSRTILDKGGAESLLGRGDMLYSGAGSPEIIRVHGAFMTDDDVQRVADNWRARGKPSYIESIVASQDDDEMGGSGERGSQGDLDPLFDEIAQFMIDGGATSISGIQRRFSLGFNRAARIIDQLEEQGILSAADSRGKREVLAR